MKGHDTMMVAFWGQGENEQDIARHAQKTISRDG